MSKLIRAAQLMNVMSAITPHPKSSGRSKSLTAKSLNKKCHAIVREILLLRDGYCVLPNRPHSNIMQNGHLITSVRPGTRHDLRNCNLQCSSCNGYHVHDESIYQDWFLSKFGENVYHELAQDARSGGSLTTSELETIQFELEEILKYLQSHPNWKPRFSQKQIMSGEWKEVL